MGLSPAGKGIGVGCVISRVANNSSTWACQVLAAQTGSRVVEQSLFGGEAIRTVGLAFLT